MPAKHPPIKWTVTPKGPASSSGWVNLSVVRTGGPPRGNRFITTRAGRRVQVPAGNHRLSLSWSIPERRFANSKELKRAPKAAKEAALKFAMRL